MPECKAGETGAGKIYTVGPGIRRAGSACMRTASLLQAEMDEDEAGASNSSGRKAAASAPAPTACSKGSVQSLRRRMDGKTGGVLAAMTTGDRTLSVFGACAAPTGARVLPMCWW